MRIVFSRVYPFFPLVVAHIRYYGTAEIKGVHISVESDFGTVRVKQSIPPKNGVEFTYQSGYFSVGVIKTTFKFGYLSRVDKRLIALNVYHHIGVTPDIFISLATSVGTALMFCRSHNHPSAEIAYGIGYTDVVSGHKNIVKLLGRLTVDPFNHAHAANVGKGFSGETRRCVAGRNYAYKCHLILVSYS